MDWIKMNGTLHKGLSVCLSCTELRVGVLCG